MRVVGALKMGAAATLQSHPLDLLQSQKVPIPRVDTVSTHDLTQEILRHVVRALPLVSQNPQLIYASQDIISVEIRVWNEENWVYIWCSDSSAIQIASQILRAAYPDSKVISVEEVSGFALWVH
jgi:hypothetical protein